MSIKSFVKEVINEIIFITRTYSFVLNTYLLHNILKLEITEMNSYFLFLKKFCSL